MIAGTFMTSRMSDQQEGGLCSRSIGMAGRMGDQEESRLYSRSEWEGGRVW